ncbi:permease-like cell division protein FtsX [Actinotalea sp. M2MS4P-6]|uniref:permease-like cell division protein FtsX n=1 Tax=Actinotalea sp. M2MS4P-6 TaxID=2983762 RepID=UPI0021E387BD|nr:permease-like cell division protein FtsX [Actinotalea sp. M2MS4P-6]MCV2393731.1 permease-like cell division protein FtsX [Actinotalea sp. M2MS4P-6]
MRLQFILSEMLLGLRRNMSMAVSVILVTFVSLTFVGAAGLLQLQINQLKDEWYDKVEVSIFLCPADSEAATCAGGEASQDQIDAIGAELESDALAPYVEKVYFESKEQAFESFQNRFGDEWWAQSVTVDQMQASYRVALVDPEQYQVVSEYFTGRQGVEEVRDQREVIEPLILVLNRATLMAAALAAVMLLAAVLLITTTIRLSAMSRRRETGIMRLVGASNLFIQLPFMLEGAIAATLGAGLAIAGLWFGVRYLVEDWLAGSVSFIRYIGTDAVWTIAPILLVIAIGLAAVSSLVSLSRYTKV